MEGLIRKLANIFPVTVLDAIYVGDGTDKNLREYICGKARNYDINVRSVNHRGYCTIAPENTLAAYRLSAENGYTYVETDISFTSDNVPVLLHDDTIDRTSSGTGNVAEMTLEELKTYDFGAWKSDVYAGETIPTLEEFMALCKSLCMQPYLEFKAYSSITQEQIDICVEIVKKYGMLDNVTWISFDSDVLSMVAQSCSNARIGYLSFCRETDTDPLPILEEFKGLGYNVFFDAHYAYVTDEMIEFVKSNNIPLEVWTVDSESSVRSLNPYVTGVTTNLLNAGQVLYDASIG